MTLNKDIIKKIDEYYNDKNNWDFVKIKCTRELMPLLFVNGDLHLNISNGIDNRYKFINMIIDTNDLGIFIYFGYGKIPEGVSARIILPEYKNLTSLYKI